MQATLITQMNSLLDKTCPRVSPHLKEKHANIKIIKTLEDLKKLNKDNKEQRVIYQHANNI